MPCVSACTVLATACDELIYITKVFTIMPERVLTTRPFQLGTAEEAIIGVLFADRASNRVVAMFFRDPQKFACRSAQKEQNTLLPRLSWQP